MFGKVFFKKRFIFTVCLLLLALLAGQIEASPPAGIRIFVNGRQLPAGGNIVIESSRILVPMRLVFEALGARVTWDDTTQAVEAVGGKNRIKLTVDSLVATKDGRQVRLEAPPKIINGQTMVPLRFVGEALDAVVEWDQGKRIVSVTSMAPLQELTIGLGRTFYAPGSWRSSVLHRYAEVWENLVAFDDNGQAVPELAERWEAAENGRVWTFYLRRGVRFHDGTPLNADAVVKNIQRLKQHPELDIYSAFGELEEVEALDSHTVRVTLSRPNVAFLDSIIIHGLPILSPQSWDSTGKNIVRFDYGTGPFKFHEHVQDQHLTVVRNDDYWGARPKLSKVTFKRIPDPATRLAALLKGEVDAVADTGGLMPQQVPVIRNRSDLVLKAQPTSLTVYLAFNTQRLPFNDRRLREAANLMLDRQAIVQHVLEGWGTPADTLLNPDLQQFWAVRGMWPQSQNKAKALELAKEAGTLRKQQEVTILLDAARARRWPIQPIAEIIQSELKGIGLDASIKVLEGGAYSEALKRGEHNLTILPYSALGGDPDFMFSRFIHSEGSVNKDWGIGYRNAEADRLIEQARQTLDKGVRQQRYNRVQEIIQRDVPVTAIYYEVSPYAFRRQLRNFSLNSGFKPSIVRAWLSTQ
ncbi:MAG: ABC transporter substrate-binding protein [Dethiobacter sp.]|jgi:peptide/nickel transport system substrate-binding protein|nr:MAG: ABC transporter substrate-binding protein [Dethiobacter sp.]